jgi:hypothetical protein
MPAETSHCINRIDLHLRRTALRRSTSANGMARPCSCPASQQPSTNPLATHGRTIHMGPLTDLSERADLRRTLVTRRFNSHQMPVRSRHRRVCNSQTRTWRCAGRIGDTNGGLIPGPADHLLVQRDHRPRSAQGNRFGITAEHGRSTIFALAAALSAAAARELSSGSWPTRSKAARWSARLPTPSPVVDADAPRKYIRTIPLSGDSRPAEQSISIGPHREHP